MIPEYINDWLKVIENMNNDNTYKLAWGRALLEVIYKKDIGMEDLQEISLPLEDIAKCMIKYYWNQLFFFKLKQSPYSSKSPIICQLTEKMINEYKKGTGSVIPVWFDQGLIFFEKHKSFYDDIVKKVAKVLPKDVSWRFKNVASKEIQLYTYDNIGKSNVVIFSLENIKLLKEYGFILSRLLNYKWTQLLEKFNYVPKIASKVKGISDEKINRRNLTKYRDELIKQYNGKAIDFYTGEEIPPSEISVDHVIPWSFMYSDDIWNLVLTSKSNNSSKLNTIPSQEVIDKLKERNQELVDYVDEKFKHALEEALSQNLLERFYYECRL